MKVTTLMTPAILACGALTAPLLSTSFKNHSSEVKKHKVKDLPPITTFIQPGGLIEPLPQPPQETTATGLPFDIHPDNLEDFPTITSSNASEDGRKNSTGASTHASLPEMDAHLEYLDLIHSLESHKDAEKYSKRSTLEVEQSSNSMHGIDDTNDYDDEQTQRIINQLQANIKTYRANKFNTHLVQVDAIQKAEDHIRQLKTSKRMEQKKIAPRSKYPSYFFPNDNGVQALNESAHSWSDGTDIWTEISKIWQKREIKETFGEPEEKIAPRKLVWAKRAESLKNHDQFPGSDIVKEHHMLLNGDKVFIPKLEAGREALRQVRAYLNDPNRVYPTCKDIDSLPRVFNHAWKVIVMRQLPINFRKDYMKMVSEYLYMVPHKPRYPQDGSDRVPVDLNARSELVPRQKDPYWVAKTLDLVFNPWVDNSLPRRDEGGLHLSFETNEVPKENQENKKDEWQFDWLSGSVEDKKGDEAQKDTVYFGWSTNSKRSLPAENETSPSQVSLSRRDDGGWFADLEIDRNQNSKDDGAKQNSFKFDLSTEWKRSLPTKDDDSQYPGFQKNDTEDMSFEEALNAAMAAVARDTAIEIALGAALEVVLKAVSWYSSEESGTYFASKNDSKTFLEGMQAMSIVRSWYASKQNGTYAPPTNNTKDIFSEKALRAVINDVSLEAALYLSKQDVKHTKRGLRESVIKLENKIGAEITKPYDELKNVTGDAWEHFTSSIKNFTSHTPEKFNFTATFDPSNYGKRDPPDNVRKPEDKIRAKIIKPFNALLKIFSEMKNVTGTFDHSPSDAKNITSYASEKHTSSISTGHLNATRSPILSIDGEAAWRKFHGKHIDSSNYRRQDLPDNVREAESQIRSEPTKPYDKNFEVVNMLAKIKSLTQASMNSTSHAAENHKLSTSASHAQSKRQATPEEIFTEDESAQAFSRYVQEIAQKGDGNYYYTHTFATKQSRPYPYVGHVSTLEDQELMRQRLKQDFEEEQAKVQEKWNVLKEDEDKEQERKLKEREQKTKEEEDEKRRIHRARQAFENCHLYDAKAMKYKGEEAERYNVFCRDPYNHSSVTPRKVFKRRVE